MVITINKKTTKKEIKKAVEVFGTKTKNLTVKDFFGKLKRNRRIKMQAKMRSSELLRR